MAGVNIDENALPFRIESGASRTEALGHNRRNAASMEVRAGGEFDQSAFK